MFWCTADVGWVTGHSYVAYGPLAAGATVFMYEGAPTFPDGGRFWKICQTHGVTIFYTAPTAIRALMKLGDELPAQVRPVQAAPARQRRRADQSGSLDVVSPGHRRGALSDRRYLVADRDRRHHDGAPSRRHRRPSRAPAPSRCPASSPTSSMTRAARSPRRTPAATWSSSSPGRPCCARSGATTSATSTPTGRNSSNRYYVAGDSARIATRTAISGSWAASTTC